MRVIAGTAGGRRLKGPPSFGTRPMTDRTREAIFNSLNSMSAIEEARVADLFAGTGALGIEAMSRGASSCVFVERDVKAVRVIKENLETTGFSADVITGDVLSFVRKPNEFDVAFVAPPYVFDEWDPIFESLNAGLMVCESDRPLQPPARWRVIRARKYGQTEITMLELS